MKRLSYLSGLLRIAFGFCPVCNSDAPALDTCEFCLGYRMWARHDERYELIQRWRAVWKEKR